MSESAVDASSSQGSTAVAIRETGSTLVSARVWEVYSPPPVNSFKGALVPRVMQKKGRRRKISVEVHRVEPILSGNQKKSGTKISYEECIVRVLDPADDEEKKAAKKRAKDRRKASPTSAMAPSVMTTDDHDDESTVGHPEMMDLGSANYTQPDFDKNWVAKYRFAVKSIKITGTHKTGVMLKLSLGKLVQLREIIFDSVEEAEDFSAVIRQELVLEKERGETKLKAALGGADLDLNERITYLIEIVSGWDIPAGDFSSSDPFVECFFEGKEVHRTKYIPKTLDPIWTIKTNSLFLLTIDTKDLFLSDGLMCFLLDFDKLGTNEKLGVITVPPKDIYEGNGERREYKLCPCPGQKTEEVVPGYLAIRCRHATDYDKKFLADYHSSDKNADTLGIKGSISEASSTKGGASNFKSFTTRRTRVAKKGHKNAGQKEYKIRPNPDPDRIEETTWMTKEALIDESLKKSKNWIDTGTGRLGRLFVEIIGCEDLPNLDSGGFAGNKTDAFVSVVYEDTVTTTDIIDDTLSPRWLPWMKRAFIFHMYHSSSQLFLGVFDYDDSLNPTDDHDLIGRVTMDISNLRKDTTYLLKYNIYTTAKMSQRKKKGSITLRLRLDIDDDRMLLLSNLEPPPEMYVNVKKRKDFKVVRYTCTGKYDMEKYSMKVINSYIEELMELKHLLYYLEDAAMILLLWRGTAKYNFFGLELSLPVHSLTAFIAFVTMVEKPQLVPSFFFACIAWILLASMDYRDSLPDKWSRCKSFKEFALILILGASPIPPDSIKEYDNHEEALEYLNAWETRVKAAEEAAKKAYEESVANQKEYEEEMNEIGEADTDITTKQAGMSIDPFKPILFPVQQNLAIVCRYLRHTKHIMSWEECYIAFWLTAGCLLLSVICAFVPWFFLIKWVSRIVVWLFFGPWMKLVDIFVVQKMKPLTEEEQIIKKEKEREQRKLLTSAAASQARIKREDAAKLKAMKKHLFGRFITRVPVLKEDRYRDVPLPESSAVPYTPELRTLSEVAMEESGYHKTRIPGQQLSGVMIPKVEALGFTEAPTGQATAHPKLVDKSGPGGSVLKSSVDSTSSAWIKIGSIAVTAGVFTWFGVPILSAATESALKWM